MVELQRRGVAFMTYFGFSNDWYIYKHEVQPNRGHNEPTAYLKV